MFMNHISTNSAIIHCPSPIRCAGRRARVRAAGESTRHDAVLTCAPERRPVGTTRASGAHHTHGLWVR